MKVLIVGSGGREHALAWAIKKCPQVRELFVAPGNAGTAQIAKNLPIKTSDIKDLGEAASSLGIDLTVVGPENPLAEGIVDYFQSLGLRIFGPTRAAAQIEASKVFAREIMQKYGIPCARGAVFSSFQEAKSYIQNHPLPVVVKADGLAAGKGVTVAHTKQEALAALSDIMEKKVFGPAGERVIVEECLTGKEASLIAFTDGKSVIPLVPARDYKRRDDADMGPNTGGMGGYSPPQYFPPSLVREAQKTVLEPAVRALAREGRPYKGVLYAGLMVTDQGLRVLEFNCRLGDPETQVTLPRLKTNLVDIMLAVVEGTLGHLKIEWDTGTCVGVVLASGGYPGGYKTGLPISGLDGLSPEVLAFHAGTRQGPDGQVYTDGGRVICVVARGGNVAQARDTAYRHIPAIHFEGCHYRKDIASVVTSPKEEPCPR